MMDLNDMACCGVKEMDGLSTFRSAQEAMRAFAGCTVEGAQPRDGYGYYDPWVGNRFRYVIFSQAGARSRYGTRFAAFIRDNGLGDVVKTAGRHINPNSNRILKVWIWTVDHEAVSEWVNRSATGE